MSEHERAGHRSKPEAKADPSTASHPMEQALLAPHMRRPFLRRLAQRRAPRSNAPTASAPAPQASYELSHMYYFDDEEAGDIVVADTDVLANGKTREQQVEDLEKAETAARVRLLEVQTRNDRAFHAGLAAFADAVERILKEEKGEKAPGGAFLGAGLSALWKLIRTELPWLAFNIPGLGGASEIASGLAGLVHEHSEMDIPAAARELKKRAIDSWNAAAAHLADTFIARHRVQIHEAYVQAQAVKRGSGSVAVNALLNELGVRPDDNRIPGLVSGRLQSALRDAIIAWKCRNDTLYGMARAASCAALPAHRDR